MSSIVIVEESSSELAASTKSVAKRQKVPFCLGKKKNKVLA